MMKEKRKKTLPRSVRQERESESLRDKDDEIEGRRLPS